MAQRRGLKDRSGRMDSVERPGCPPRAPAGLSGAR
jgi:hypothetical protein